MSSDKDDSTSPLVSDEAVKDQGAMSSLPSYSDLDFEGHRAHLIYSGLHIPGVRKRGHHRHRHRHHHNGSKKNDDGSLRSGRNSSGSLQLTSPNTETRPVTPPSQRVQFILGEDEEDRRDIHPLFSEMEELHGNGDTMEWRETARWVKFEEDVEEGGNRWSKPHVATLSLHSLFELRSCVIHGSVMLNLEAQSLDQIADMVLGNPKNCQLPDDTKEKVKEVLLRKHRHQHERSHKMESLGSRLPLIRSLADIGRIASKPSFSSYNSSSHHSTHEDNINLSPSSSSLPSGGVIGANGTNHNGHNHAEETPDGQHNHSVPVSSRGSHIQRESSSGSDMQSKGNHHFMRKIPPGAEASNILVGELNYLERPIIAFIRLSQSMMLGDLTEVPVPTRFLFILLGPEGNLARYHQIGRAVATLMSDEVFHDVAYKARNQQDLLAGIDEFLDAVTVLPPGEWDPSIRIEPPSHVPSQQSRITNKPEIEKDESLEEAKLREESGLNRTGRLFGGLINDIKRKRQCYIDDYKDALAVQCLASFFFIYFACLTPIVTFGGLLGSATKSRMAAIESLLSGAIVGTAYALFSGQPLTILGSTGPVLIFETMVYDISSEHGWDYLSIRLWIGMWMCLILILLVAFDASALVCYITRFTEENFATLISLIFIVKAIQELLHIAKDHPVKHFLPPLPLSNNCTFDNFSNSTDSDDDDLTNTSYINCTSLSNGTDPTENNFVMVPSYVSPVFLMSCLLFIATYIMLILLKDFKTAAFFPTKVRHFVSDFAVIIAIVTVTVIDFMTGLDVPKLDVPNEFKPTWEGRQWVVPFFGRNPWWSALIAILPAILATILVFMDQQITAVIVNRKENKLKKGCGYHLDLLIVAVCIGICAILGLPWFVAATVISMTHVNSLKVESECAAPGEKPQFLGVREQRVTHLLVFIMIGLSVFLTKLLHCIPMPVLYGVFLYMGTSSLKGSQFCDRILLMFMPQKYQPDYMYLRHVPTKRVHLFTLIQIACLAALWGIKSNKSTKIIFPLMVAAMIGVRKLLDFVFTQRELKILDDVMPESTKKKHDDEEDGKSKLRENEQDNKKVLEATPGFPMVQSGNVHIHLANGNVMTIPVTKMGENKQQLDGLSVNITEEMTKTRTWQNIDQNSSAELNRKFEGQMGSNKRGNKRDAIDEEEKKRLSIMNEGDEEDETKRLSVMNENDEEEDSGITINIHSPTPDPSISDLKGETRV